MSIRVTRSTFDDLDQVVATHLASFPGFFLSALGPRFLREFYAALIRHPQGHLYVAFRDSELLGFVGGATEQVGFYGDLFRERKWRFGFAAVPALLRRPWILARLLRARQRATGIGDTSNGACLMTLGVRPNAQGSGVGQVLVAAFEDSVRSAGAESYCLTTDADNNVRTNQFYCRLGLEQRRVLRTSEGRMLNEYWKDLSGSPGEDQ